MKRATNTPGHRRKAGQTEAPDHALSRREHCRWRATILKHELTGRLSYEIQFPVGDGTRTTVIVGTELSTEAIAKQLKGHSAVAIPDLTNVLALARGRPIVILTDMPGWRFDKKGRPIAYVSPGGIIGPARKRYRWQKAQNGGRQAGTAKEWLAVANLASQSNYLAFALMVALSGPLLRCVERSEDAVFHFFARTTVGKTVLVKAAQSVYTASEPLPDWAQSPRALEENAAGSNEMVCILNAMEKVPGSKLAEKLNLVAHVLAEGQSPARSQGVQERYPDKHWRCFILSTGNKSGAEAAKSCGRAWDEQDAVRFIDIPVPNDSGGIFDRVPGNPTQAATKGAKLIKQLEMLLASQYGTFWPVWIKHLFKMEDLEQEVQRSVKRFVKRVAPATPIEARIAHKFGLVYAAGWLASKHQLLPWEVSFPRAVVETLFRASRRTLANAGDPNGDSLRAIVAAADDPNLFAPRPPKGRLKTDGAGKPYGLRFTDAGQEVLALRADAIPHFCGGSRPDRVVQHLADQGALLPGHGNKRTRQLNIRLNGPTGTIRKPRFYIIAMKQLRRSTKKSMSQATDA